MMQWGYTQYTIQFVALRFEVFAGQLKPNKNDREIDEIFFETSCDNRTKPTPTQNTDT